MPRISKESVELVFNTAEIEDIVSDYIDIKKRGSNYIGLCPFHNEKTPSFVVSPAKNIYKCFGCGEGGNPINFVMDYNGSSFVEAVEMIADKYGIELEYENITQEEREHELERDSNYILMKTSAEFYQDQLHHTEEGKSVGLQYFKKRGFRKETLSKFNIGYAPNIQDSLYQHLKKKGFEEDKMASLGLLNKYGKDFFKERLIFPILNESGKYVAFAGRTIGSQQQGPKYINSPETEIYEKRKILYGLYLAKSEIRKLRNCYIVEGYTDVMSLHQAGVSNVVATSGTSLTEDHARILKRHTDKVTFIFDSDKAGMKAADRGSKIILEQGLSLEIVLLPEGDDPDSFAQANGKEKFDAYVLQNVKDYIIYKLERIADTSSDKPAQLSLYIKSIMNVIAVIPHKIQKQLYIKEAARILDINETYLIEELRDSEDNIATAEAKEKLRKESRSKLDVLTSNSPSQLKNKKKQLSRHFYQEQDLIRVILQHGKYPILDETGNKTNGIEFIYSKIQNFIRFNYEPYHRIINEVFNSFKNGTLLDSSHFLNHSDREIQKICIDILTEKEEMSSNWVDRWDYPLQTQLSPDDNHEVDIWSATFRFILVKIPELSEEIKEKVSELSKDYSSNKDTIDKLLNAQSQLIEIKRKYGEQYNTIVYDQ